MFAGSLKVVSVHLILKIKDTYSNSNLENVAGLGRFSEAT